MNDLHEKVAFSAKFCTKQCHKPGVAVSLDAKSVIAAEEARRFFRSRCRPPWNRQRDNFKNIVEREKSRTVYRAGLLCCLCGAVDYSAFLGSSAIASYFCSSSGYG